MKAERLSDVDFDWAEELTVSSERGPDFPMFSIDLFDARWVLQ